MFRHLMKLHTKGWYETIQLAAQRLPLADRVQILTQLFGACPNAIPSALAWQPGSPCGNPGAPRRLPDHRILYIEARTLANRSMTNHELGRELVALIWDDAAKKRLADAERKWPYHSTCLIDVNSLFRIVRIQNS
jgi:hypothetical protein